MPDPIAMLLEDITRGTGVREQLFADDAVLDATVPGWRFAQHGPQAISAQLSRWFADAGAFDELSRTPLPGGELVTFTLSWVEEGIAHAAHQAHVLAVKEGLISHQQVWCGGRWPADLLAEMAAG